MKETKRREPAKAAANDKPRRKKRRRLSRFHTAVILFVAILAVSTALIVLIVAGRKPAGGAEAQQPSPFGIKKVVVVGETRYDREAIIGISGLSVGQSIFSINKKLAAEKIAKSFPYIETVSIRNASFDTIEIDVKEVAVIGARYAHGRWIVVGQNGKALEELEIKGDRPPRLLYLKGVTPADCTVGGNAMDERSLGLTKKLLAAFDRYQFAGVGQIDMTSKTDIRLDWKNQITILLGNDSNLEHQIAFAAKTIPQLLENYGESMKGQFDLSSYSDAEPSNDKGIFTPEDQLPTGTKPAASTTTGTSAAGTTAA